MNSVCVCMCWLLLITLHSEKMYLILQCYCNNYAVNTTCNHIFTWMHSSIFFHICYNYVMCCVGDCWQLHSLWCKDDNLLCLPQVCICDSNSVNMRYSTHVYGVFFISSSFEVSWFLKSWSKYNHASNRIMHKCNIHACTFQCMQALLSNSDQENSSLAHSGTFSGMGLLESPSIVKSRHIALALSQCLSSCLDFLWFSVIFGSSMKLYV